MDMAITLVNNGEDCVEPVQLFGLIAIEAQRGTYDVLHGMIHTSAKIIVIPL